MAHLDVEKALDLFIDSGSSAGNEEISIFLSIVGDASCSNIDYTHPSSLHDLEEQGVVLAPRGEKLTQRSCFI